MHRAVVIDKQRVAQREAELAATKMKHPLSNDGTQSRPSP
jgi:hypothetical protein